MPRPHLNFFEETTHKHTKDKQDLGLQVAFLLSSKRQPKKNEASYLICEQGPVDATPKFLTAPVSTKPTKDISIARWSASHGSNGLSLSNKQLGMVPSSIYQETFSSQILAIGILSKCGSAKFHFRDLLTCAERLLEWFR